MRGGDGYVDDAMVIGFETKSGFDVWVNQDCYVRSGMDVSIPDGRPCSGCKF